MILLAIVCLLFFFLTVCLVCTIIHLMKKKPLHPMAPTPTSTPSPPAYPKLDRPLTFPPPSSPVQMAVTSNQIASVGNMAMTKSDGGNQEVSSNRVVSMSAHESSHTQSFDNFETELKRTWQEKGIVASNDDEVETVNEVLGMEERSGKVFYKVNFTGHPPDYTAWVCEEDLIPE
jgi:hypothetical protein